MAQRLIQASRLDKTLAQLKKEERNFWGRVQQTSNVWLSRLERNAFLKSYATLFRRKSALNPYLSEPVIDLDSLFFLSVIFHLILFFLLTRITVSPPTMTKESPVVVRILDMGEPAPELKKETPKRAVAKKTPAPAPLRAQPQPKPAPVEAEEQPTINPTPKPLPAPAPLPVLPGPKTLAQAPRETSPTVAPQSTESLVQLPTRQSDAGGSPPAAARIEPLPGISAGGDVGAPLPAGLRRGDARQPAAAAGSGNLSALTSPDFAPYLEMIKKRVQSVWKYPDGVTGVHQVNVLFVLDRAGKLVRAEIVDSTEPRLSNGAMQAMRKASPFPPIPESLKELTGWPLRMRFTIDFGVKTSQ